MDTFTKQDWVMIRDALRWFSDQQEAARAGIPENEITRLGAQFDAWRRRLADEIEQGHGLK